MNKRVSPKDAFLPQEARLESLMRLAIVEARRGLGRTTPNPAVGAVLVREGRVVSTGYHARAGEDHAEVAALRRVGFDARGCTLYCTLEPCNHQGRTGPCTEAILRAGVESVVVGARDPNPRVRGRGIRRLREGGVRVVSGVLEEECVALNEAYNFAVTRGRPFVVLKAGMSLDGSIATHSGQSRYITSKVARQEAHRLRNELDAILVGVGTVLEDDPALTTRLAGGRDPVRVVMDTHLRIPLRSRVVRGVNETRTVVLTRRGSSAARRRALVSHGVEVVNVACGRDGRLDPAKALSVLASLELNSVLLEGGSALHGAFVKARLVDKVMLFVAPMIIGGLPVVGGSGARTLDAALTLRGLSVRPVGRDLLIVGYPRR